MKQKQLCLFDIGMKEIGSRPSLDFDAEPRGYIVEFIAKTGSTFKIRYDRRQAREALKDWSRYPSKIFIYW